MVTEIKQAETCISRSYLAYQADISIPDVRRHARNNGVIIRSCYAKYPESRSERLLKELVTAQSSLESNANYWLLSADAKSEVQAELRSGILGERDDSVDWIAKGILGVAMGTWAVASAIGLSICAGVFALMPTGPGGLGPQTPSA